MKIPEKTVSRLSLYYRQLQLLAQQGTFSISSKSFSELVGLKPEQVRKDLSYFGSFGKTGFGYNIQELKKAIARILGLALAGDRGFEEQGLKITAIFDNSPSKIGKKYKGRLCRDIQEFPRVVKEEKIEMAILAVPADSVQEAVQMVVAAGISGILNFAPVHLKVPKNVRVNNVDLASEMKSLSYFVSGIKRD
jgi:redox-sensing transcriptional repressor